MTLDSSALSEALDAWRTDLGRQLETARVAAADLLSRERSDRGSSPVAHRQWARALIVESTTAGVLRQVCEELEEILDVFGLIERADNQAPLTGVIHTPPVPGDEGPEPF